MLESARIIVDIKTMDEARRIEEAIKSGYIEAIIESLVSWLAVEEDLADSYERFSREMQSTEQRDLANRLLMLSNSDADILRHRLEEFEGLNNEYRKRIQLLGEQAKKTESDKQPID